MKLPGFGIKIAPLKPHQFTPAKTGRQIQHEKLVITIVLCLDQKSLHFIVGQHLHFPCFFRRQLAADCRVYLDQPFVYRLFKRRAAACVTRADHPVRQSFSFLIDQFQTPSKF